LAIGPMKEVVITKEEAVFRLDKNGRWHNRYGPFEHKKIIDHFHACIRKDAEGFFLSQELEGGREKVYFPYEDTALFVFDVIEEPEGIFLILNTKKRMKLMPKKLFIENDSLYMSFGEDRIKFAESALFRISDRLVNDGDRYWIRTGSRTYKIADKPPAPKHSVMGSGTL